ncbi:MAG TPA: HAMP domain-containing sensor histidine kinase, partial [Nocardioidaceae bacterium]|nr:HAMP domain-containing sensor histidine kinase [Nocardioidaceae bacterium]
LGSVVPGLRSDPDVVRARSGDAFTAYDDEGATVLVPVVTDSGTYVVHTSVTSDRMRAGVARAWTSIVLVGLLLLAAALVIADRLARRVSTPVTALAHVALQLRDGELDARAEPEGPEETVELAHAFNQLAERISELLVAERAAVGDLSHRLRTPVTALRLDVEAVADPAVAARLQEHVATLQRTVDAIIRDARRPVRHAVRAGCDARAVVAERMAFWSALADDQGRRVHLTLPDEPVHVAVDATDLTDVLDVLVDNVFAHTPESADIAVTVHRGETQVEVTVRDNGPGLGHDRESTEPRAGSTGLGLQIARRTMAGVGGSLSVQSEAGRGTTVVVGLPTAHAGA